mmetsp:Transcript_92023/g.205677  ORF Transcript_92023/g.205677 Transcript_92023/m.205677 type:complete len:693 (+) Transcript_92023:61-2139(+)
MAIPLAIRRLLVVACVLLPCSEGFDIDGCTSIIVNSEATVDGSAIASHSNDCQDCDFRMVYVPAHDHKPGSSRTIYDAVTSQYPRLVDPERSSQYVGDMGIYSTAVLGSVPQANHTYAIWEASYGVMNEHGLGMGESTCPSFLVGKSIQQGGDALFTIGNLMALALERCTTARCAIQTMGDHAERYGFFGEDPGMGGAGEATTIVDKAGEAWVFHVTGGVKAQPGVETWKDRRGALWVAQRVPVGHVAVIANSFIIRVVDPEDHVNFMMHPGLFELAQEAGLWSGHGQFDFQQIMQPDLRTFSYFPGYPPIPMYSTLRMWGVYRQAAPSAGLRATPDLGSFPFSVPVDGKVTHVDVMQWFRTHYEDTEFDMRLGALAGPWQSPNRAEGGHGQVAVPGQFARSTSITRTSYTVLLQSGRIPEPTAWFAPDASATSVFAPFFASVLAEGDGRFDVDSYGTGSMKSFSFGGERLQPAWWAFDFVANWLELSYQNMSETYVYPRVHAMQAEVVKKASVAVAAAAKAKSKADRAALLGDAQTQLQRNLTKSWWSFAEMLVVRYNDFYFNFGENANTTIAPIGYPAFWLEMIGYDNTFYRPHWLRPAVAPPTLLPMEYRTSLSGPESRGTEDSELAGTAEQTSLLGADVLFPAGAAVAAVGCGLFGAVVGASAGYRLCRRDGAAAPWPAEAAYVRISA